MKKVFTMMMVLVMLLQLCCVAVGFAADESKPVIRTITVEVDLEGSRAGKGKYSDNVSVSKNSSVDLIATIDMQPVRDGFLAILAEEEEFLDGFYTGFEGDEKAAYIATEKENIRSTEIDGEFILTFTYPTSFPMPDEVEEGCDMQGFNEGAKVVFEETVARKLEKKNDKDILTITVHVKDGITIGDLEDNLDVWLADMHAEENGIKMTRSGTFKLEGTMTGYISADITFGAPINEPTTVSGKVNFNQKSDAEMKITVNSGSTTTTNKGDNFTGIEDEEIKQDPTDDPSVTPGTTRPVPTIKPSTPSLNKEQHGRYILGYPEGDVRPNNNITREEMAVIFYRLLTPTAKEQYASTDVSMFSDVQADYWSTAQVATLANMGIIKGYEDGTFHPFDHITRAEFATMACRFAELADAGSASFADIKGHWAEKNIDLATAFGWIAGYEDGSFRPENKITRAEAVTIINRVLDRHADEKGILAATDIETMADVTIWSDLTNAHWAYYEILEAAFSHEFTRRVEGGTIEDWAKLNPAYNLD